MPVPMEEFQAFWALKSVKMSISLDLDSFAAWKQLVSLHAFVMVAMFSNWNKARC